jgi:hypothetical protein
MSSHFARATGSEMRTIRKSGGTLCTAPGEIAFFLMDFILLRYGAGLGVLGCSVMRSPGPGVVVSSSIGDTPLPLGDRNLIKKWLSTLLAGASLISSVSPLQTYAFGNTSIILPAGWQLVESSEDKLVFRTKDNHQQATITVMHFGVSANFEDFKLLCEARFKAERSHN